MPVTTTADVKALQKLDSAALESCVARHGRHTYLESPIGASIQEAPIIGSNPFQTKNAQATPALSWAHGFELRHKRFEPGAKTHNYTSPREEVLFVHRGRIAVRVRDRDINLEAGDVLSLEIGQMRNITNMSQESAEVFTVQGGNSTSLDIQKG